MLPERRASTLSCHNALARCVGHVIARIQHLKSSSILKVAPGHRDRQGSQGNSMNIRKPLVAGFAVAALMLSPLSAFAQEAAPAETPAVEAPAAEAPAATDAAAAPVAGTAADPSTNWLKLCDPLPDNQVA